MALPTLSTPTYELTVPSTKKKIKYRPFLVKEEKVLLLALESEDDKEIANAMKGLIKACVLTKGIDPDELATFDVEYIFLNISCLLYTSPSPRDMSASRMPSSA